MDVNFIASFLQDKVKTRWTLKKYSSLYLFEQALPYSVDVIDGNLFLNGGSNIIWTAISAGGITLFNNTNAKIKVGDSSAAEVATQTDLQGTNTFAQGMDGGFPNLSGTGNSVFNLQATVGGGNGNFAWNEFGVTNGTIMLNRKVSAQGTKISGQVWTLAVSLSLV